MILRLTAVAALGLGLAALLAFLHLVGKGPFAPLEARHLRDMKDRSAAPAGAPLSSFAAIESLPHGWSVAEYSATERRGVTLEGYVQRMLPSSDGDIHLELAERPRAAGGPDTAYVTAEVTPIWRRSGRWGYEALVAALRPNHGGRGPWTGGPRRVRVSGWLLYDYPYDQLPTDWSRLHGARLTGWEIHPVTAIALWDEGERRFVEWAP